MGDKKNDKSFWGTLPGILTAFAAVITAIGGLLGILYALGSLPFPTPTPTVSPVINSFTPDRHIVSAGESCTLSWDVADATRVMIDHGIGNVALTGTRVVSPTETTTYTLTAENEAGTVDSTIQVVVQPQEPTPESKPVIHLFTVNPSEISLGESCTLSWDVADATRVTIYPGIGDVPLTGNRVVSPTETTTYTLTAQNEAGIVDSTIQVTVTPPVMPPKQVITAELPFVPSESGWVGRSGFATTDSRAQPMAGDWVDDTPARGFISFDLSIVPDGATVQSAVLNLPKPQFIGDPIGKLDVMIIEAVWYDKGLQLDTFDASSYTMISSSLGDPGVEFDITNAMLTAVQRSYTRIQIRFSFSPDSNQNGEADLYIIPTLHSLPIITVEYRVP